MAMYQLFAHYHKWAYQVLFKTMDQLEEEDYFAECGLALNSIHGTLNHLYFGDNIWFCRFTNQPYDYQSIYDVSFTNYAQGKKMILAQCEQWIDFVNQLVEPLPETIETRHFDRV
ncbi:MAG: hypothetical protein GY821_02350 [Gammaproteobacteria bacterium]|nr:hypothetical protein [Gammaproteobacteria bacterium]